MGGGVMPESRWDRRTREGVGLANRVGAERLTRVARALQEAARQNHLWADLDEDAVAAAKTLTRRATKARKLAQRP
jgi:hypothetical protein